MYNISLIGLTVTGVSIVLDTLLLLHGKNLDVEFIVDDESISPYNRTNNNLSALNYYKNIINIKETPLNKWVPDKNRKLCITIINSDTSKHKRSVYVKLKQRYDVKDYMYAPIVHPSSVVSGNAKIANGVFVGPNTTVAHLAELKKFTYLSRNVSVGHDCILGKFSSLNPNTAVGGRTTIGNNVTIGMGATVFDKLNIGGNTLIGGGSVVTKSIPKNVVAYGSPAKVIKNNDHN